MQRRRHLLPAAGLAGLGLLPLLTAGCGSAGPVRPPELGYRWPASTRTYTYNLDAVLTGPAAGGTAAATTLDLGARFRETVAPLGHGRARITLDLLNGQASRNGQALGRILPGSGLSLSVILNRQGAVQGLTPASSVPPAGSVGGWAPFVAPGLPHRPLSGPLTWSRTDTLTLPDGSHLTVDEHDRLSVQSNGQLVLTMNGTGTLTGPGLPAPGHATVDGTTILSAGTRLPLSSRWTASGTGPDGQPVGIRISLTRDN